MAKFKKGDAVTDSSNGRRGFYERRVHGNVVMLCDRVTSEPFLACDFDLVRMSSNNVNVNA